MAELENLEIIIDVIDQFSEELNSLLAQLAEVESVASAVDPIRIDVDVTGEHELEALEARLAALESIDLSESIGDIVVGDKRVDRSTRGGRGGMTTRQFNRLDEMLTTQVKQMGLVIRNMADFDTELDDTTQTVANVGDAAEDAADSFKFTNLRMSDLHNAMANVIPLLAVFIGAMPAVITGMVAVAAAALSAAAALAAIGGFAALGAVQARGGGMEGLSEIFNEIQEDFMDAFQEIATRLAPLFEDMLDGLDRFFQRVANLDDILMGLTDEAQEFGAFMSEWVTGLIRDMGLMAEAFSPIFSRIGSFLEDMNLLLNLTDFTADILPDLILFTRLLIGATIRLAEMSKGFLQVANAVGILFAAVFKLIDIIPFLDEQVIGSLIATFLVAASAAAIYGSALWSAVIPGLVSLGRTIIQAIAWLAGYVGASGSAIASTLGLAASFRALAAAIALTGIGAVAVAVGFLASKWVETATGIDAATESLRSFRRERNRMGDKRNPYASPDVRRGEVGGRSRFAGSQVNVTVEGDANAETVRNQTQNALYRLERPKRSK